MSLEPLLARAEPIGLQAAEHARDRILARAVLPDDVRAERINGGIALTGKRLRLRVITNLALRNFAR
jgi:hypothetical protein